MSDTNLEDLLDDLLSSDEEEKDSETFQVNDVNYYARLDTAIDVT